ncbi:autophagy protein 17 [Tulasnella sp. 418]|nr:autophagy protein 17 [Tulasnella sp. 418]
MAMANFDLVALVVQSKRALQHAELICTRTDHDIRSTSALVVEILSNDAKVRWMTDGIAGQLGLATIVAESITARRVALSEQLYQWESERSQRTGALDSMLEMLSQRLVPPALHLNASSSSLFGSQHEFLAEKEPQQPQTEPPTDGNVGASASLEKSRAMTNRTNEKSKWKTLRDFVDERGIDEVIDRMDSERATLEDYLAFTASHADSILARIAEIKARLPIPLSHSIQSQGPSMPSPSTSPSSPSGIKRPFSAMPVDTSNNEQGTASHTLKA